MIYTYFIDKNHIFLVVVSAALEVVLEEFRNAVVVEKTGLDRIFSIGKAYVTFALTRPEYYSATLRFQFSEKPLLKPQTSVNSDLLERFDSDFQLVLRRADQINQFMFSQIVQGLQDGSIRKEIGDPLEVALSLWAITGGLIQTSSANKQIFSQAYGISQDAIISQGLRLAKEGLRNQREGL